MVSLTKTGWGFLGLCFLLYLSSVQSESGLLFLILGIVAGCFVINIFKARRSALSLGMESLAEIRLTEGRKVVARIELSNPSDAGIGLLSVSSPYGTLVEAGGIEAGSKLSTAPDITFRTRGIYPFSGLKVSSEFPFGLARYSRRLGGGGEFVVLPALYKCQPPKAAGFEAMVGGGFSGRHRSRSGVDFAGIRPLQPTDPVKLIHWKSSSKGIGVMVREYSEELSGRISFILDCSPVPAENGERRVDWAVRCAGSLIFAALDVGHHAELIDLAELEFMAIPPFSGGDAILERLARVKEAGTASSHNDFDKALAALSNKSAICMILTSPSTASAETASGLAAKRRTVSAYLPAKYMGGNFDGGGCSVKYYTENSIVE